MTDSLPVPSPDARAASARLVARISQAIATRGGWLPFSEYMQLALYCPGLGYYTGGAAKLGALGDFVTAPEISDLFGRALARQILQIMECAPHEILEVGGGSGRLALQVLQELRSCDALPQRYRILEVSAELRERQARLLDEAAPELAKRVEWVDALPERIGGIVLANEVLDAMPVEIVTKTDSGWQTRGVALGAGGELAYADQDPDPSIAEALAQNLPDDAPLGAGYTTELHLAACGFVASVAERLDRGVVLLVDYGFPAAEYHHPERHGGTLMAHYRHRAHPDPFFWPGLQDVTAHVDFSAIARAANAAGAEILGYTSQARFLVNCGILELIEATPEDPAKWLPQTNAVQRLLSEAEMGELFKVLAFGRGFDAPLLGFLKGDRSAAL